MALRATDLEARPGPQPELHVVPPPPRRHGVAAAGFVVLLCALLSVPVVSAALEEPPSVPIERPRALAAGSIGALDRLLGVARRELPRSPEHFAGIAFVRCTGLWVGEPDGSNARKVLPMSGISSPTFSGDGRSLAFVHSSGGEQSLWVAGADGTDPRKLGTVTTAEAPLAQRVTGLAWAPNDDKIAFALVDATYGPLTGGSAIWTHDISSGKFARVMGGWPAPAWRGNRLLAGGYDDTPDLQIMTPDGRQGLERRINSGFDDLAAAVAPLGWWNGSRNEIAILRSTKKGMHLAIRDGWRERDRLVARPPRGYRFARFAQPAITQDGARVAIDLLDPGSGRDLGLLDPETGVWEVLDYAWDPTASPVPTIVGSLSRADARGAAEMLLSRWRNSEHAQMLTEGWTPRSVVPWRRFGWALQDPVRSDAHWVVPATVYRSYGSSGDANAYRIFDIIVDRSAGRLTATPVDLGSITRVTTPADAHAFAEIVTGMSLPALPSLPPGSVLPNYALSAWSWGGKTQASITFRVPTPESARKRDMTFSFGEDIDFSLGCGGAVNPEPVDVAGQPGMADRSAGINQVIWPATPEDASGPVSIHGDLSRDEILDYAEEMGAP